MLVGGEKKVCGKGGRVGIGGRGVKEGLKEGRNEWNTGGKG